MGQKGEANLLVLVPWIETNKREWGMGAKGFTEKVGIERKPGRVYPADVLVGGPK